MVVEFRGSAPHHLGIAERATIRSVDGNIEVTLHVLDATGIVRRARSFEFRWRLRWRAHLRSFCLRLQKQGRLDSCLSGRLQRPASPGCLPRRAKEEMKMETAQSERDPDNRRHQEE